MARLIIRGLLLGSPLLVVLLVVGLAPPRWLMQLLPGAYPEVVYFVPTDVPVVALTIDDGVDPATTPGILDVLAEHDAQATFFIVSDSVAGNEALVQRLVDEGHELAHHMTEDEPTFRLPRGELEDKFERAAHVLEPITEVRWFRAGMGIFNEQMRILSAERGYRVAMASMLPWDTAGCNPTWMTRYILWVAEPGSIVVLHDVGKRGRCLKLTLQELLPSLQERGFSVTSLSKAEGAAHDD